MRIFTSCFIVLLLVSAIFISCGGSDTAGDAHTGEKIKPDVHAKPDQYGQTEQTEQSMLMGKPNCPQPNLKLDVALNKKFCGTDECLVDFAGYTWWTNFHFRGTSSWWWSNDQGTSFSPRNAFVSGDGLHLKVAKDDLGGGSEWMSAEVVALYKSGSRELVNFSYGTYLVSAKILTGDGWAELDKNVAFGVFTYDNDTKSSGLNERRELDLAEISKWGGPENVLDPVLKSGNAQFAIQPWAALPQTKNVHRYTIDNNVKELTLVMIWNGPNQPVTFKQFNGSYNLNNLPSNPNHTWTTTSEQNPYIPDNSCQKFHINFWMGNYGQGAKHPGPSNNKTQEVVVTNFVYQPK